MNEILNNNFWLGMLLAINLPREKQLNVSLAASLFPQNNVLGPLLLKSQIDDLVELEAKNTQVESTLATTQKQLEKIASELTTTQNQLAHAQRELEHARLPVEIELSSGTTSSINLLLTISGPEKQTWTLKTAAKGISFSQEEEHAALTIGTGVEGLATLFADVDGFSREVRINVKSPTSSQP